MGGKSGGGGGSTTVQKADPWSGQQPYLEKGFRRADDLYNSGGPDFYNKPTYTPFAPQSEMGMNLMEQRALAGSPLNFGAQSLAYNTMAGDYLNNNPYLDNIYQQGAEKISGDINATFSGAGRTGSGAHTGQLADSMGDLYNNIYGGNYQQERDRQMQTMGAAPMLAATDYQDLDRLMGVGQVVEGKAGEALSDNMNRFNFYQNRPEQNLQNYIAAIQGNYGGTTATSQDSSGNRGNPLAGAAGGALAAYGLGSSIPALSGLAGPWGLAGGALLGALT